MWVHVLPSFSPVLHAAELLLLIIRAIMHWRWWVLSAHIDPATSAVPM